MNVPNIRDRSSLPAVRRSVFAILLLVPLSAHAVEADLSKRPLEHRDYDVWSTISTNSISRDGKWVMYAVASGAVDGETALHIRNTSSAKEYVVQRGADGRFSYDSRYAVFRITPAKKELKKLKKAKTDADQMPKAKLQILQLDSGDQATIARVKSFAMPEENGDWLAYLMEKPIDDQQVPAKQSDVRETYEVTPEGLKRPEKKPKLKKRETASPAETAEKNSKKNEAKPPEGSGKGAKNEKRTDDDDKKKDKPAGTRLVLRRLDSGVQQSFPSVARFAFAKNGKRLAFVTSVKPDADMQSEKGKKGDEETDDQPAGDASATDGVHVIDLDNLKQSTIATGVGEYKRLAFTDDGSRLAFLTNKDDYEAKTAAWSLYHWRSRDKEATQIATEGTSGVPAGWWVAPNSDQQFSEDGRRLYFETAPIPESVIMERAGDDEDEDDEEKAVLDIWHWQDPQLQPQQLLQAERERNRDYRAAYNLKSKRIVQLATREMPDVSIDYRSKSTVTVATTNIEYRKTLSWDVPGFQDTYLVNLDSGKRTKLQERVKWTARISPEGKYISWFDAEKRKWFALATSGDSEPVEISAGIKVPLQDELHDRPMLPGAYGTAGWIKDDIALLIYDRFDIWQVDPTGQQAPLRLTTGRERKIRFRYRRLDRKERAIDPDNEMVLTAFDEKSKASGFYSLRLPGDKPDKGKREAEPQNADQPVLRQLIMLDENLAGLRKAETTDDVVFTRSTFRECPDLWSSTLEFKQIHRISDINPQQDQYSWGTAKLVDWKGEDGQPLRGILYQPDGFDPQQKYPLMVYFYERNSDRLHSYYPPAAGRSIINHSFYVSRGYLLFVPDIPYKTGQPGPSAANSILPGVKSLIAEGFVDEDRIGIQGHSWGGYQAAYLVTQTDMFACAEAGAPVSNMTSAYGGIRWSSGLSRMFQYERTQSRIGDDLWAARDKYVANSPLFFADKINTPLLILHNDEDGAVPWYQGIELFVALRRLEKPAWMLNYNGDPHWVMGEANRRDFAIRMQQFFDHYLQDAPEPEWMAVGVPAVDKGKKFGLELLEPEEAEEQAGDK